MHNSPDVIVLCGGAGLRLRTVIGNAPKSMARIGDRPFLELLLRKFNQSGFRKVILATGYKGHAIREYFGNQFQSLQVEYSQELSPLGTAGALRNAAHLVTSDAVLVSNGDSYTDADLVRFVQDFQLAKAAASLLVVPADGRKDCGTVAVGPGGSLLAFNEKNASVSSGYLNAGVYLLSRQLLNGIPAGEHVSLEYEFFPRLLHKRIVLRAFIHQGQCLDIGTPDRYQNAQEFLQHIPIGIAKGTAS